jgi:predicted nucleotidyltransferase
MEYNREKPVSVSSSQPPLFATEQESLFRQVIQLLEDSQVKFAVSGAFALHEYTGIWRDTKDLDLFLPAEEASHALQVLQGANFHTEIADPVWLAKAWRDGFFVDLITGMSNAVVRVDASWIQRALRTEILGLSVRVLQPEELIASKIFVTRRERFDAADICHIIYGTRGKLDWGRLLVLLGEHWQMLLWHLVLYHYVYPADTEAVPEDVWEELLQRFKIELAHPDTALEFRGSLIDEMMFAIDVTEWGRRDILEERRRAAKSISHGPVKAA